MFSRLSIISTIQFFFKSTYYFLFLYPLSCSLYFQLICILYLFISINLPFHFPLHHSAALNPSTDSLTFFTSLYCTIFMWLPISQLLIFASQHIFFMDVSMIRMKQTIFNVITERCHQGRSGHITGNVKHLDKAPWGKVICLMRHDSKSLITIIKIEALEQQTDQL